MARVPAMLHSGVNGLAAILLAGTIVLFIAWVGRQIQRDNRRATRCSEILVAGRRDTDALDRVAAPMPHKPIAIVAILTIYHNLQYHRLIWFHNKSMSEPEA